MPPLTPAESELSILRSELYSIESLLDDVLQRQALLLSQFDALHQGASCSSECPPAADIQGPSEHHSPSWASIFRKRKRVSLPLFTPEDDDLDPLPLHNFFTPLERLTELAATCSHQPPGHQVPVRSHNRKHRTPPMSLFILDSERPRRLSPPQLSSSGRTHLTAQLDPLQLSLLSDGPVTPEAGDDVISTGDSNLTISDTSATILSSLSSKITVNNKSCFDRPPEILIIGDSIIRNVELPGAITYCLSGGKIADFASLKELMFTYQCTFREARNNNFSELIAKQGHNPRNNPKIVEIQQNFNTDFREMVVDFYPRSTLTHFSEISLSTLQLLHFQNHPPAFQTAFLLGF